MRDLICEESFLLMLEKIIYWHLITVPISAIKCEQKKIAIEEGWGGQTIGHFPPCGFYRMFNDGFEENAVLKMKDWYHERFVHRRLYDVGKKDGGMRGGSLYKMIATLHHFKGIELEANLSNANETLIHEAIKRIVQERFELLKSIQLHGYSYAWDYISARKEGNHYILINGHHRVAVLYVLCNSVVPVVKSNLMLLRFVRRIIRHLQHRIENKPEK